MRSLSHLLVFTALFGLALSVQAAQPTTPDPVITAPAVEDHGPIPWLEIKAPGETLATALWFAPAPAPFPGETSRHCLAHRPRLAALASLATLPKVPERSARAGPSHKILSPRSPFCFTT